MKPSPDDNDPGRTAMASPKADLRELSTNTRATVFELQKFLHELKGRGPQEMLGIVAGSHLVRSLVLSTVLVAGTIAALSVIPFLAEDGKEPAGAANAKAGAGPPASPAIAAPIAAPTSPESAPAPDPAPPRNADLSILGVGEEKPAPPKVNPLDKKDDQFLEGLD